MSSKFLHRDLWFARAYYFAFLGGWGFVLPFINLFYISLGLSGTQIGTIGSVSAIVGLITSPILVSEIKKRPQARGILQASLTLGAIAYFLIGQQTAFFPILLVVFFQALIVSGTMPASDAMAVHVSEEAGTGYGSVRVWASVGWIITVLTAGWLIERKGFEAGFFGVSLMWLLAALITVLIQPRYFVSRHTTEAQKTSVRTAIRHITQDRTLFGYAIAVAFMGFLNQGVLQFENVFLAELGASKQLISVAGILSAIVEIPFLVYADRYVRRKGGHHVMLLAVGMVLLQRLAVLLFPSIATIMIVRFVGGVSFSFMTIASVFLISSRTAPEETGTVLAIYTVTLTGLVNVWAAPVAGAIFDATGARWLYGLAIIGYGVGLMSMWITRPLPEDHVTRRLIEETKAA
ncbi:MAG TPA: MFS transporter [Anaerolineales bacterium]|nr:MFS transporter [Anaerolineales bacterium]